MIRLILIFFLAIASNVAAEPWTAKMVDYGEYSMTRGGKVENEKVAAGLVMSYGKQLLKETDRIAATIGTNFGFRYMLAGPEDDVDVTIKVKHPTPLKDPETGKEFSTSEWGQSVPADHVNWNTGWIFEKDWEIVPGEWTMQLYVEDKKLLEKRFFVSDGRPAITKNGSGQKAVK